MIITSVASMIDQFNLPNIQQLQSMGYEVTVITDFDEPGNMSKEKAHILLENLKDKGIKTYNVSMSRYPIHKKNYSAFKEIKQIISETKFDIIHCQSPVGGAIGRLAAHHSRKLGTKVIYTGHGFHFYKGAPLKNWLLYFPVEKILSYYTDRMLTINKEDYNFAKRYLNSKKTIYVPGVGIDTNKIKKIKRNSIKRAELGLEENDFVILSVGELNDNKNHQIVIKSIAKLDNSNIHYIICGKGDNKKELMNLSLKLGISDQIHILGFRTDVSELYKISNLFILPSKREGLSVALMEAMASGLPIICSNIRGNVDLIDQNLGGMLFDHSDISDLAIKINQLVINQNLRKTYGEYNVRKVEKFDLESVLRIMHSVYSY